MKVAINTIYGGFGLSEKAFEALLDLKEIKWGTLEDQTETDWYMFGPYYYVSGHVGEDEHMIDKYQFYDDRTDKDLIKVIELLGAEANTRYSKLKIVEIPDDIEFTIEEYDGNEWVAEKHRTWS